MRNGFAPPDNDSTPIEIVRARNLADWLAGQDPEVRAWVLENGFKASLGEIVSLPSARGTRRAVVMGWGDETARRRGRFHAAIAARNLPAGTYHFSSGLDDESAEEAALGWLLQSYSFDRYKKNDGEKARLIAPVSVDAQRIESIAAGAFLTQNLINAPACDMGPDALESAFRGLAAQFGAQVVAVTGDDLKAGFPLIHAVGRAAASAPRILDLRWGRTGDPKVTLVGKGVCFDTGGLNLKPGSSMGLMKKDMGGAATVMGLAQIIMATGLAVRLRVLVPAVENAVAGNAMRPGDILTSRKGLTVEVNNTDAEGRLVLADALALADDEAPDYLFCLATLTGAARVALGPDVVPFYTADDTLSHALSRASRKVRDPIWRMPLWTPYDSMIEPDIADLDNAPKGGFAGSITAALFLRRFVENAARFAHFDIYGWTPKAAPGRPKGAAFQAARAVFDHLSTSVST